ncbi:MAG: hypothetical protein HKM04_06420 [Legionellales bacterium]|nr:hypothetical protein [Legionellales bacterium]
MISFFNLKKLTKQITFQNSIHVIEFYSYTDEQYTPEQIEHEIVSGTNAGSVLTAIYQQDVRFIYAPDQKEELVLKEAENRGYSQQIVNLYEPSNVSFFSSRIKPGDSVLINGLGDPEEGVVAGYNAVELIDILQEELMLKNKQLKNLDIDSCLMGRNAAFCNECISKLSVFQTITTYTELCSVSYRNSQPSRLWIEEIDKQFNFYTEDEIDKKGIRKIGYTILTQKVATPSESSVIIAQTINENHKRIRDNDNIGIAGEGPLYKKVIVDSPLNEITNEDKINSSILLSPTY